jgi:hypothetical protein
MIQEAAPPPAPPPQPPHACMLHSPVNRKPLLAPLSGLVRTACCRRAAKDVSLVPLATSCPLARSRLGAAPAGRRPPLPLLLLLPLLLPVALVLNLPGPLLAAGGAGVGATSGSRSSAAREASSWKASTRGVPQ